MDGQPTAGLMVHHSRNTVEKQWDETRVIAFQGVARTFQRHFAAFLRIPDAKRAWLVFFEHFEEYALQFGQEVVNASLQRCVRAESQTLHTCMC